MGLWPGQPIETPIGPTHFHFPYGPRLVIARVPKLLAGHPALEDEQLNEVVAAARSIAAQLGAPVDVEWCFDEGDLVLLQARPVTTAPSAKRAPARCGSSARPPRILRTIQLVATWEELKHILVMSAAREVRRILDEQGLPVSARTSELRARFPA